MQQNEQKVVLGWAEGRNQRRFGDGTGVYHMIVTCGVKTRAACSPYVIYSKQLEKVLQPADARNKCRQCKRSEVKIEKDLLAAMERDRRQHRAFLREGYGE